MEDRNWERLLAVEVEGGLLLEVDDDERGFVFCREAEDEDDDKEDDEDEAFEGGA